MLGTPGLVEKWTGHAKEEIVSCRLEPGFGPDTSGVRAQPDGGVVGPGQWNAAAFPAVQGAGRAAEAIGECFEALSAGFSMEGFEGESAHTAASVPSSGCGMDRVRAPRKSTAFCAWDATANKALGSAFKMRSQWLR